MNYELINPITHQLANSNFFCLLTIQNFFNSQKTEKVNETMKMKNLKEIKKKLGILNEEVKRQYKAEVIGIFGSYVWSRQRKGSDLDVLVKFYEGATLFDLVGLAIFLEEKLGIKKVDVVPYDSVREEIRDRVFKETVYL